MKYLVSISVQVEIDEIEIDVESFDQETMAKAALEKWLNRKSGHIDETHELELTNWNSQD